MQVGHGRRVVIAVGAGRLAWQHRRVLTVRDLRVDVGGVVLLDGVTFTVRGGDKVGLVGRNGAGKTTMLKILGDEAPPAHGQVRRDGGVGYLPQDPRLDDTAAARTGLEHVLSGRGLDEAVVRMEKLRVAMEEDPSERAVARYSRAEERFRLDGGYQADSDVRRLAAGLGLTDDRLDLPVSALSGGERRRVELARILFAGSDLLLLDEPTNHLDSDAKEWLLDYMRRYRGGLLVISHDLDLLDEAITRVIHLDRAGHDDTGTMYEYRGTYSQYVKQRAADEERRRKEAAGRAKEVDRLQGVVDRFGAKATKATMAHSIEKRIARIEAQGTEGPRQARTARVRFPDPPHAGRTVLEVEDLSVTYGANHVFADVEFSMGRGERMLVMGFNGAGKTSLLRIVAVGAGAHHRSGPPRPRRGRRLLRPGARGPRPRPVADRPAARGRHRPVRVRAAGPARHVRPDRRQGLPRRRHPLRRGEDQAGPHPAGGRPPQPAAPRRAHQQPRPRVPRGGRRLPLRVARVHRAGEPRPRVRPGPPPGPGAAHARRERRPLVRRPARHGRAGLAVAEPDGSAPRSGWEVEHASERMDPADLGPLVARGRDAEVFALGTDRVVRRLPVPRDLTDEAAVMEHARGAGYPVPRVWRVAPGEMVLERIEGPTMLDDLGRRPWRVDRHARTLADLHRRLHVIDAPPGVAAHPWPGSALLHLDLHPANVILAPDGPVVIDWTNAKRGGAGADLAEVWMIVAALGRDVSSPTGVADRLREAVIGRVEGRIRARLLAGFLAGDARDQAREALLVTARVRLADPNVSTAEAEAIRALVRGEVGEEP